jgi:hypothetical protein
MTVVPPKDPQLYGELARRLSEDADQVVLADYRERFEAARLRARRKLHEPLTAADHAANVALVTGTEISLAVVAAVWSSLHH